MIDLLSFYRVRTYLAKIHTFDTFATQCRPDRRTGTGLTGSNNQFDDLIANGHFSRHVEVGDSCSSQSNRVWSIGE